MQHKFEYVILSIEDGEQTKKKLNKNKNTKNNRNIHIHILSTWKGSTHLECTVSDGLVVF